MASNRHSDSDGSDIFWPGYVDAVTNLVLNLLFLLTIMTVAVFMFALELGRSSTGGPGKTPVVSEKTDAKTVTKATIDPVRENRELKLEIQRLQQQLAQKTYPKTHPGVVEKTTEATTTVPVPQNRIEKTVAPSDTDIVVRFSDEAVTLTPAEHDRLRELLKPIVASGRTNLVVEVPAGFSEAKRLGYYRAMAIRNLLIEMKMPKEKIDMLIREGKSNANASLVRVKAR